MVPSNEETSFSTTVLNQPSNPEADDIPMCHHASLRPRVLCQPALWNKLKKHPFLPHLWSFLYQNLAKTWDKHEKSKFRPLFGMHSTKTLVQIYNICRHLLINFHFHFKQYFKCPFEVESNGINNILPLLKCRWVKYFVGGIVNLLTRPISFQSFTT